MKTTFTSSFDANIRSSHNSTSIGCFSSILRRFLRSGSFRTHPFDCVKEFDHHNDVKIEEKLEASVTPGIVARLMGLETMPELNHVSTKSGADKDSLIRRSQSVNAADNMYEFDSTRSQHRRVKTSLSFRELPIFLQQEEDDNYLVLSFVNVPETSAEMKQKKGERSENKENRRDKQRESKKWNSDNKSRVTKNDRRKPHKDTNPKQEKGGHGRIKQVEEIKIPQDESNSDNSSPISVLHLIEFTSEPESLLSEEDSKLKGSNSRRILSAELAYSEYQCWNFTHDATEARESYSVTAQVNKSVKMDSQGRNFLEFWGEVCKLTEEEMQTSKWITRKNLKIKDFEVVGSECGLQILDHLIEEVVRELLVIRTDTLAD